MATLTQKKSGCWSIQYDKPGERRKTITLSSTFKKRTAEDIRDAVKKLLIFRKAGLDYRTEDKRLRTWIETASPVIRDKLADHGFITIAKRITTRELWDMFIAQKTKIEESTLETYMRSQTEFFAFFKENEWIADLTKDRIVTRKSISAHDLLLLPKLPTSARYQDRMTT